MYFAKVSSIKTQKVKPIIPTYWITEAGKWSKLIYADLLNIVIFRDNSVFVEHVEQLSLCSEDFTFSQINFIF